MSEQDWRYSRGRAPFAPRRGNHVAVMQASHFTPPFMAMAWRPRRTLAAAAWRYHIRRMRLLILSLLSLLAAGCVAGNSGGTGLDVNDRLTTHWESGCDNGPTTDRHGLQGGGNCADFSAGERDLYVDWAHDHDYMRTQ